MKLTKPKILNFKNNLNFVRKMKYFTQGVMVIIVIINFFTLYESCGLILLLFLLYR
jgi:hypothetical protein